MDLTPMQRFFQDERVLEAYERLRKSPFAWPVVGRTLAGEVADALRAVDRASARVAAGPVDVLDLACGQGTFGIEVAAARPDVRVTGLDLSRPQLDRARGNATSLLDADARLVHGDATRLPFRTGAFAAIVTFGGIHQIPDQRALAAELARVCRPGGVLFGACFARRTPIIAPLQAALGATGLVPLDGAGWGDQLADVGFARYAFFQRTPVWGVFEAERAG